MIICETSFHEGIFIISPFKQSKRSSVPLIVKIRIFKLKIKPSSPSNQSVTMAAFFELKVNQKYLGEMSRLVPSVAERKGRWGGGGREVGVRRSLCFLVFLSH